MRRAVTLDLNDFPGVNVVGCEHRSPSGALTMEGRILCTNVLVPRRTAAEPGSICSRPTSA
jgi:hypothetical protein